MRNGLIFSPREELLKKKRSGFISFLRLFAAVFLFCGLFSCGIGTVRGKPELGNDVVNPQSSIAPISGVPEIRFPEDPSSAPLSLPEPILRNGPHYAVIPENPRPGDPVTIAYADNFFGNGSLEVILLDSRGREQARARFFSFTRDESGREVKAALLAVPSTVSVQNMTLRIATPERIEQDIPLALAARDFLYERIYLNESNTEIRSAPSLQRERESEANQLWAILSRTGSDVYATDNFVPPVASTRRTSLFGSRRIYQYVNGSTDTSIHAGVDIGVPTGTQVLASARGKVVLARSRIVSGNTVIVEHAPGVYSLYYHMDSLAVEEGGFVEAGTLLGLSGSTGLSTGPHLHWEIRVAGENTDPDAFVARPILDKDEILSKLVKYEN